MLQAALCVWCSVDEQEVKGVLTVFERHVLDLDGVRFGPSGRIAKGRDQTLDRVIHTDRDCLIADAVIIDQDDSRDVDDLSGLLGGDLDDLDKDVQQLDLLIDHVGHGLRRAAGIIERDSCLIVSCLQGAVSCSSGGEVRLQIEMCKAVGLDRELHRILIGRQDLGLCCSLCSGGLSFVCHIKAPL